MFAFGFVVYALLPSDKVKQAFHLYIGFCFSINIFRSVFKIDKQGDFYKRCDVLFYILECFLCDPYSCGPDGIQD